MAKKEEEKEKMIVKDVKDLSTTELKAAAFDLQQQLQLVLSHIQAREVEAAKKQ